MTPPLSRRNASDPSFRLYPGIQSASLDRTGPDNLLGWWSKRE
ncbi:predicted protein [Plenodomus lingam JN3]|uniref:Predicted protein n=1 Tax=Leptosphaeria maculans (strain JN3 / isolate v23.1.3 / race Av1-4-5-6-7-8) TaxID=985895 RepID=E5AB12_LEPMJ|nr:predicted protein [Plenodomus lingam JN3]CBY00853.1 predicted protein [Plenodomus lingam JN3]